MSETGMIEMMTGFGARERGEREGGLGVVIVQGMADLKELGNEIMAGFVDSGATGYDPGWHQKDGVDRDLEMMLSEFGQMVEVAGENGKPVVVVGVSAGAGLALLYKLRNPEANILHLYSASGVLDPNINSNNVYDIRMWRVLCEGHPAFTDMVNELSARLGEKGATEKHGLRDWVTVLTSGGVDGTVPKATLEPEWVKVERVGNSNHVGTVITALGAIIGPRIRELKQGLISGGFE
jgi:pimeloyl-ACP methyl ester carboxylesterase